MPKKKTAKKAASKARTTRSAVVKPAIKTRDLAAALSTTRPAAPAAMAAVEASPFTVSHLMVMYVATFVVNIVIVAAASWLFPTQIVLGTHMLSPLWSLVYSMGVLTLILMGLVPVIELVAAQLKLRLMPMHWMALYWVMNAAGLWLVARFAEILGFGISSWLVAALLAVILDVVQGMVIMKITPPPQS